MTVDLWNCFVFELSEKYGVSFGVGANFIKLPENEEELKEAWFTCPDCNTVVYYKDYFYGGEFLFCECPICGFSFE